MRDIPREIPINYRLEILFSGSFFIIGLVFLLLGSLVIYFRNSISYDEWYAYGAIILFLWGVLLIIYTILKGIKKLNFLIWGKMVYGRLLKKEFTFKDISGNASYKADFMYPYGTKNHKTEIDIPEAYNMEEDNFYLLIIERDHPEKAICLEQFSENFIRFFINRYHEQAKAALREQGLSNG